MATNTEQEELHKTIWAIANDLRGAIDGWSFKAYVLGAIFYRYISENITGYINKLQMESLDDEELDTTSQFVAESFFDYAKMDDAEAEDAREQITAEKGFFILPSQLFCNVVKNCEKDENLNETLSKIFRAIEASAMGTPSEEAMRGLFSDFVVDNTQLGSSVAMRNQLLARVLIRVRDMALGSDMDNREIDTFGDTYEFLMQMYAANAGKSGGEFFTPQEVSELLASLASHNNENINMVYDPACGSGSLLLKFKKVIDPDNEKGLKYYGQEINPTTFNLCRINMFLHDINFANFDIQLGDTLIDPKHLGMEFDAIVSNPPYSIRWAGKSNPLLINDERYAPAGVLAPESKADFAFTMHMLHHLSESGTCAIVEFPGVLHRGGDEQKIRKYLVENNYVDTVIQLPQNLFFGVSIATCILVLKKSAKTDSNILFIDASEVFHKVGNKNKLYEEDQKKIFDTYKDRKDIPHFAKLISNDEVKAKAWDLAVSSHVKKKDRHENIAIPDINDELTNLCTEGKELRKTIDAIVEEFQNLSMNRIEKMIKEKCPDGVKRVKLCDLLDYEQPSPYIVHSTEYDDSYATPVLTAGQSFILGYTDETDGIYTASEEDPTIIFDDFTTSFHWVDFDFKVKSSAMKMLRPKDSNISFRYVYFAMKCIGFIPTEHARHWISKYSSFEIPLPPYTIQNEIVKLLDNFTELYQNLKDEITLRQKQYEYYREKLLTF